TGSDVVLCGRADTHGQYQNAGNASCGVGSNRETIRLIETVTRKRRVGATGGERRRATGAPRFDEFCAGGNKCPESVNRSAPRQPESALTRTTDRWLYNPAV